MNLLRRYLPGLAYFAFILLATIHPAYAAGASGGGGLFAPVVAFVTNFETAIILTLGPICFLFWVGVVGAVVANGGHINGLGWTMLGCGMGTAALLLVAAIIGGFGGGAVLAAILPAIV